MMNAVLKTALFASVLLFAGVSSAAEVNVYLKAQSFDKDLPDGMGGSIPVKMWGFASCADDTFVTCNANDAPGLQINAAEGDDLNIHLHNGLPLTAGNISLVIPGQVGGGNPMMMDSDTRRVRSLTNETAPGTTVMYTWSDLRAGTYLYQSGTHQSIQVPMGLYGALIVGDSAGSNYASTVLADGPSHYYRLGESTNVVPAADEAGASDGAYESSVMRASLGYSTDGAAGFDGTTATAFVDTGVTTLLDSAFSVEAWVNANDTDGPKRIVAKDELGIEGQFILWFQDGKLRFHVRPSTTTWVIAEAPTTPPAGTTFHVVGVFDGTDAILYVDGAEVARTALLSPAAPTTTNTNTLPITIGASSDPTTTTPRGHFFDGTIDEVAIYESALSATQIEAHYLANNYEPVLLFSEIDPIQNERVDAAAMLAPPTQACVPLADFVGSMATGYPCTIDYNPFVLLVNGEPKPALPAGAPGRSALLRMLNAGLRPHTPAIVGLEMALVAEDGNAYPGLPRRQSKALLPAGKTLDAYLGVDDGAGNLVMPNGNATFGLFDREPTFTNEALPNGGGLVNVQVGTGSPPGAGPSPTFEEVYAVTEDTPLTINPTGFNNVELVSGPSNGTIEVTPPPYPTSDSLRFVYTPNPDFSGTDSFVYRRQIGNIYHATLNVSFENDAPVATADGPFVNAIGTVINVPAPGVLGNDKDVDGDVLTAVIQTAATAECPAAPSGFTLNSDGSFSYTTTAGPLEFCYFAHDGAATSDPVLVTLEANPVPGIALTVEEPGGGTDVTNYRWTVEEDVMWQPDPSVVPPPANTLATNFHKSYMPIVAQGTGAAEFALLALDPAKHYYVSVLPADAVTGAGHTIGGARISPADQVAQAVTVNVNPQPIPSAQISIFVFEDSSPTNGSVDGAEQGNGLGGFQITLEDGGGRYGISAGQMSQDAFGNPLKNALDCFGGVEPPMGVIVTCPDLDPDPNITSPLAGQVLIQNLFPGKYGIIAAPPAGDTATWAQTSTIEGSKVIDAWVKAGEPAFFQEFGPAGWHVFMGFVNPANLTNPGGTNTVTGTVTNLHMSRPPSIGPGEQQLWDSESNAALAHTRAWVGLNSIGGLGDNIAAVQADADGNFTIDGVPDGNYQLVVWDSYLDQVIAYRGVILPAAGDNPGGALGNVPVFQWFTRSEHHVFLDENLNGILDDGDEPIAEQAVNLRWRDGTVNQSFPTDLDGFVPFDQTFPFFHWQVLEVDFARFKATGLTTIVDGGGDVTATGGVYNPQVQGPCTQDDVDNGWNGCTTVGAAYSNPLQRTETGPVLTQGFQGFLGQTSVFKWGKAPYEPGENGGISGIVYHPSTRAENDPRLAAAEPWEPGIPGVTVRLYREVETSGGGTALALVDETTTDDWDNSLPTGCPGADPSDADILGGEIDKCYDGLRNFNQARPAVFDGGYAFMGIPPGKYIVEVVPPSGFDLLKEEDNNVGYGDSYDMAPVPVMMAAAALAIPDPAMVLEAMSAEPGLAQPPCVGVEREVPDYLSLFPAAMEPAPFAGDLRPLCDRKEVILSDQGQAAADFYLFTGAPIAGHFAGMILDDIAVEFSKFSPQFSEKWAPPFVPVSVRDYNGNEISRFYSDQWGRMNGLVPSTFTANMPSPSGFSPAMHTACMNDPGPIPDPENPGQLMQDPQYNAAYSNFCYTFQYMPGTTTYLDTPVLPVSAFAAGYNPPDCALDAGTPMIFQVDGTGVGPLVDVGGTLRISSMGMTAVPNPAYEGPLATGDAAPKTIPRDFGFGACADPFTDCSVTVGGMPLTITLWDADTITATVPIGVATGQLVVTRDNGISTESSITVTVGNETPIRVEVGDSIQDAIDAAAPGSLILVEPGIYEELVIMSKPVRLQGAGAGSTFINAVKRPAEKITGWRTKMDEYFGIGGPKVVDALPNQPDGAGGFGTEEGAGITVVAANGGPNAFENFSSRIDGFSITGGDIGGGIFVNGWAHDLEIANNKVFGNAGLYAGGIRVGRPFLQLTDDGPFAFNTGVNIHNNAITQNGGLAGAGGGLSIATGTDDYTVSSNFVCGNFTTGDGGGIGHFGLSDNGMIKNNKIMFNQSFNQAVTVSGGGLFIGGERVVPEFIELDNPNGLGIGSGSVTVDANLIQGNQAASGHGGGIRTQFVNGLDVTVLNNGGNPVPGQWHSVTVTNNMIVNNVAGWSGAGIAMLNTARSFVINNTIAHNDSTATVSATFTTGIANPSANQPAGISTEPHSAALIAAIPDHPSTAGLREFSDPVLENNIVWQNRSFHYDGVLMPALSQSDVGECIASTNYWDLGVLGGGFALNPRFSVLTDTTGFDASNISGDPALLTPYCNGGRTLESTPGPMTAYAAVDEGGTTWIDVRFGPLIATGDYHIDVDTSSARGNGIPTSSADPTHPLKFDFDGENRPQSTVDSIYVDRGADEVPDGESYMPPTGQGTVAYTSGAFGEVLLTDTATLELTAVVSDAPVLFASPAVTTDPAAPFAYDSDTCSGETVAIGGTCTITMTYTPTVSGTDSGSFVVANDSIGNPQTVNLSGTGIANIITFSPGAFGQVPINTTETLTVTATVLGDAPLFGGATIFGTGFAIDSQACSAATCSVTVSYSPTVVGDSAGSLTILSDGFGSPHVVDLSGSGVAPATVAYSSGDFGDVLTGTTAELTIEALVSGVSVTFDNPAATGPVAPFAILSETCSGSTVSDGATCSFTVTYSPTAGGPDIGSFSVGSNATGNTQVDLMGTGVPPGTVAFTSASLGVLAGGELDFGNGGQLSSTITLTVGVGPVTFDTVTVTGGRFDEAGGGTCEGATIAVGATCTVVVDFNGGGNATRNGTLTVLHDGSDSPSTLSLTGN